MKRRSAIISTNQLPGPLTYVEKFGARGDGVTNDTAAIQAGINAMSVKGSAAGHQGFLYLTPGKTYKANNLLAASNCVVWAYGARFVHDTTGSIFNNPLSNPVSNFEIRGGWIQGTPTIGASQGALVLRGMTGAKLIDVRVSGIPTNSGIFIGESSQVWIDRCTVSQCCYASGAGNSINLVPGVNSNTNPLTDIWVTNCLVEGYGSQGISMVPASNATQTDAMRMRIENNTVIARNQAVTSGNVPTGGIEIENGANAFVPVDHISIVGNTIDGSMPAGLILPTSLTGTTSNGSTQVTGVTGTGNTVTLNGQVVTGSNIPASTTLVNGGGTGTWTLSKPATGAGSTALTVTAFYTLAGIFAFNDQVILDPTVNRNVVIADNNIRNVQLGIQVSASNVEIANNRVATAIQNAQTGHAIAANMNSGTQLSGITGDTDSTGHPQSITNIAGANNTSSVNGMRVTGTGVTTGTTVVTGGGTATWVLSLPTTATNTGVALTVMPQLVNVNIVGNLVSLQPDNPGINMQQVANSSIKDNLIRYATGSVLDNGGNNSGIGLTFVSNVRVQGNSIDNAPENGINANHCNDLKIIGNQILNPAEGPSNGSGGAEAYGIHLGTDVPGASTLIADNSFDDTRVQLTGITGDTDNVGHPTTITNVPVTGGNSTRVNGMYVTGAGIPSLTRVVSGGGTATWTLSASTTAAATGVALTVTARAMLRGTFVTSVNSLNNRATGFIQSAGNSTTVTGF